MLSVLKILVVDDHETMCKLTAGQLMSLGVEHVSTARSGAEALRLLRTRAFDVLVTDVNMPGMDGLALLKTVRDTPAWASMPVVMITADAERGRIEQAIGHGVNDLLVKPYTAARLALGLERALRRRPLAPATDDALAAAMPQAPVPAPAPQPPTLLLVDDVADNLHLLADIFKGQYRVRAAYNGTKALEICASGNAPDLVLLDVMMPGIDGFEVARQMRAHPNTESTPIIFVTALQDDAARLQGMTLGAIDFIAKPIDPTLLKLRVDNFMRYVQARRQLQLDYDNLIAMARLREDVEAMTRHDLKGPLASAVSLLRGLAQAPELTRRQTDNALLAEDALLKVIDMINRSSELYRIETGRFELDARPIALGPLLRRVAEGARHAFAQKHLSIAVDADVAVGEDEPLASGDETLCFSLLGNLLRNACEAAPDGSRVTLTLLPGEPQRVSIANTGAVPEEFRPRFFEKFATAGKPGGSGLGAYSARLLARAQRGEVELEVSDEENRTVLHVLLPRAAGPVAEGVASRAGRT